MEKKETKKKNRGLIILGTIVFVIVLFNICFMVFSSRDDMIPGSSCTAIVGRIGHFYIGTVTKYCSAVDCEDSTRLVSGYLSSSDYQQLKKEIRTIGGSRACSIID